MIIDTLVYLPTLQFSVFALITLLELSVCSFDALTVHVLSLITLMVNVPNGEAKWGRQLFNFLCIHGGYTESPSVAFRAFEIPSPDGTCLVNTGGSANCPGPAQTKPLYTRAQNETKIWRPVWIYHYVRLRMF